MHSMWLTAAVVESTVLGACVSLAHWELLLASDLNLELPPLQG